MKDFDYAEPKTLEEACSILSSYGPRGKILAGGTDLLVQMKRKKISPACLVSLKGISGLEGLTPDGAKLRIGALTLLRTLEEDPVVQKRYDFLSKAAGKIGSLQIRNLGTLGGNICNASPSADLPPSLIALDATLELFSLRGRRSVPIDEFFKGPFQIALEDGEVLEAISIEGKQTRNGGSYRWIPKITEVDESLVGIAVYVTLSAGRPMIEKVRIVAGSMGSVPCRVTQAEDSLIGKVVDSKIFREAGEIAAGELSPRSRAKYRREMARVLVEGALDEACGRAIG
jgi:CO/xanthine dehydrogenase FAD-binding subunit